MKNLHKTLFVLAIPVVFLFFTGEVLYPTGSPGGRSGSPGDGGHTCTDCHAGTSIAQEVLIYSPELMMSGYSAGQTYNMFVIGYDENAVKYGFEATAEDNSNNKVGTFTPGFGGFTQTILNAKSITHTLLGTTPIADTGTVWMFQWTAPAELAGDINFYVAVNAANGNGNNSGDQIYTSSFMTTPATGVSEKRNLLSWSVFPNPSNGNVTFKNTESVKNKTLSILNIAGQLVSQQEILNDIQSLDLSSLEKGVYFVRFDGETQRLIIH